MAVQLGVLVSSKRYHGLLQGGEADLRNWMLAQQNKHDVRMMAASPTMLDPVTNRATMAVATPRGWQEETFHPIPRIYLNLLSHPNRAEALSLRVLNGSMGLMLFNELNRWNRRTVFSMLAADARTQSLVCPVAPFAGLPREAGLYLLAPVRRSPRKGGYLLEADGSRRIRYTQLQHGRNGTLFTDSPPEELTRGRSLLVSRMPGLPAGPDGPVEWRFYLIRSSGAEAWKVAGSVAKRDMLRRGGRTCAWPLREALTATFGSEAGAMSDRLHRAALDVINTLTLFIPGIAHCAVDFWVDRHGSLQVADVTGHYRTDWLARIGDTKALELLHEHPVLLALFIAQKGVEKLHVDFGRARDSEQC